MAGAIALFVGQLLLGWLFADFIGGILHYVEDRQLLPGFLDRAIGKPNRLHHADPLEVTRDESILRRNSTTWAAVIPISLLILFLGGLSPFWAASTAGGLLSYEVHRLAHGPRLAPRWALVLQEIGLIQSPKHHSGHHRSPYDRRYCILTDWLNPVLDAAGLFRRIDAVVGRAG